MPAGLTIGGREDAMPKLDLEAIPQSNRTGYPTPFDEAVAGRWWRRLALLAD